MSIFMKDSRHGKICTSPQCCTSSSSRIAPLSSQVSLCAVDGGDDTQVFMSRDGESEDSRIPVQTQDEPRQRGRSEGEDLEGGLRPSRDSHRHGRQPVRPLATMLEVPEQDLLHAARATPDQEGEGHHGDLHQGGEGGSSRGREGQALQSQGIWSGIIDRREGIAGDAGRVQSATPDWNDHVAEPGHDPDSARAAGPDGDVATVHDGPGSDAAVHAEQTSGTEQGEHGGVGSSGGASRSPWTLSEPDSEESPLIPTSGMEVEEEEREAEEREDEDMRPDGEEKREERSEESNEDDGRFFSTNPKAFFQVAQRLENIEECGIYHTKEGEYQVSFHSEHLRSHLNEEDLCDDYEAGIPRKVKKTAEKVLHKYLDLPTMLTERGKYKIVELFSPARVTPLCEEFGCTTTKIPAYDLENGWDFFDAKDRRSFWKMLEEEDPDLVVMTPECRAFSQMMNVNWERMSADDISRIQAKGMAMFQFCIQVAEAQMRRGKDFLLEQPDTAKSWNTESAKWLASQPGVARISFDQCRYNLRPGEDERLARKGTSFMLNHLGVLAEFYDKYCQKDHEHVRLEGGLTHKARIWPENLVRGILEGVHRENRRRSRFNCLGEAEIPEEEDAEAGNEEEDDEDDEEEEKEPGQESTNRVRQEQGVTEEQKSMLHRLHVNLGHLPIDRMRMMLKAAKAKDEVLEYVKDGFKCEVCMRQRREISRRKAAYPRTFEFKCIVGVDTFFIKWQGKSMPFLNVVDHGSNWQMIALLRPVEGDTLQPSGGNPTSEEAWMHFLRGWIRPHGPPEIVVSDGGMEFRGRFERGLEQFGVMQSVTDQESPWQNGRAERHGLWVKDRIEMELSGGAILRTLEDLKVLAMELVAYKNGWFNRGGYSPAQLVYGKNPRLPAELLSDAGQTTPGWDEALCDPTEGDTATAEFRRNHGIRERARQLAMEHASRVNHHFIDTEFGPLASG